MMTFEKRRMHPAAAIVSFVRQLRELLIPFLFFFIFGTRGDSINIYYMIAIGVGLLFALAIGVFTWLRFYYWVEDGELRIEHGVFVKKKRFIPLERIQTIDTSAGIIQRMFGIVKLQVETAGSGNEAEAVMTAVTKEDAAHLKELLLMKNKARETDEEQEVVHLDEHGEVVLQPEKVIEEEQSTYRVTWKDLLIVGSTSGGVGVVLSGVIAFTTQIEQLLPMERVFNQFGELLQTSIIFISTIIFFVLLVSWIISIGLTMLRYGNFHVVKKEDKLIVSRGIIEKKQMTIPLGRIQAVRISQNIIRQPFGLATVYVESAGGSSGEGDTSTILFPLVKLRDVAGLLSQFTPDYNLRSNVNGVPKRSFLRYNIKLVVPAVLISGVVSYFFAPYGFISFILIPLALLLAFFRYKDAGWYSSEVDLQLSYRVLSKNIVLVKKRRMQCFDLVESFFQRRRKVVTIATAVKSSWGSKYFKVVDVDKKHGEQLYQWYSYKPKS
ncbi:MULTISPECIES: PH domain-containing protein [Bacillus]|uniref:PH domain-containing protein n=1 Tax=Bacillus TaxID=1386 RepID=UPI000BB7133B|nr:MULTISPECIES: PH domain-containing protein [Bacillus]